MCGFVGFTGVLENKKEILNRMMGRIIHRGPDMADDYTDEVMALGFRRLSIIDLSEAGSQPMQNEDGSVVMVFNGEIYNYIELRKVLKNCGHTFLTESDSEVLVHAYEEYGVDVLDHIRGMFAFAIWDRNRRIVFAARDFFGIKPFYYTRCQGDLIFGSEIKSFFEHPNFQKRLNENALRPYMTFQYSSTDETFFKGVYKLPPAHYMIWHNGEIELKRYWNPDFNADTSKSFEQWTDIVDDVINESVSAHRIADVKVGTFLSGGVDSSYITASMMPDKTFSVGYSYEKFDETNYASELSDILGIQNIRRTLTAEECMDALPTIQYHMDEPQSNPSSIPLYFLAELASEYVTVVLSGEGADEIFAGYDWYNDTPATRKIKKLPQLIRSGAASVAEHLPYFKGRESIIKACGKPERYFIGQALVYSEKEAMRALNVNYRNTFSPHDITERIYKEVADKDELSKKQYLDMKLWLPGDILLKADKMGMAHSLELRVPFLDKKVMETAERIPSEYKINGNITKHVLRAAANKTLPDEWANRAKKGFPVPIRYWFKEQKYYKYARDYFTSPEASQFFEQKHLVKLLDEHYNGKANNGRKIWTPLVFLVWYDTIFNKQ